MNLDETDMAERKRSITYVEVTVYIDELWLRSSLLGIGINIFLKYWMKLDVGTVRLVMLRLLQTTVEVLLFAIAGFGIWYQLGSLLLEIAGLTICFTPGKLSIILRLMMWDFFATVAAGGIMNLFAAYLMGIDSILLEAAVVSLAIMCSIVLDERREVQDLRLFFVTLSYHGRKVQVRALYDTGNRLQDPYVHRPVSILSEAVIDKLGLEEGQSRLVPYHCINGENELIQVWTIDGLTIGKSNINDAVVAKTGAHIFKDKEYEMILAAGLFGLISERKEGRRNCYVHKD